MVLSVIYGVYTIFFAAPREGEMLASSSDKELEALNSFITKVADKTKNTLTKEEAYILQKAQEEWKQDPLIQIKPQISQAEKEARQPLVLDTKLLYTGYLQMGGKRLAIINNLEYEIGDKLEPGGLIVRNIYPNHVVIGSAVKKSKKVVLPLEEIE